MEQQSSRVELYFTSSSDQQSCVFDGTTKTLGVWISPSSHEFSISRWCSCDNPFRFCPGQWIHGLGGCKRDIHRGSSGTEDRRTRLNGLVRQWPKTQLGPAMPWSAPLRCFNFRLRAQQKSQKLLHDEHDHCQPRKAG